MTEQPERMLRVNCPRCGVATAATVLAVGQPHDGHLIEPTVTSYFCRCESCLREFLVDSYFSLSGMKDLTPVDVIKDKGQVAKKLSWKFCFPSEHAQIPEGVPDRVAIFFSEGVRSFGMKLPHAAGAMFRKTLDVATVDDVVVDEIDPSERGAYAKKSLFDRVSYLAKNGLMAPAIRKLADVIRAEGNIAVHSAESYALDEAQALMEFTHAFLLNMFTLPAKMAVTRSAMKRNEKSSR